MRVRRPVEQALRRRGTPVGLTEHWELQAMARRLRSGTGVAVALGLACCLGGGRAEAADILFQAEAQTLAATCTGQAVRLEGNHNTVSLTGQCASLLVKGVANAIQIGIQGGGLIHIEGSDNRVRYGASTGGPAIEILGPNNEVVPGVPQPISPAVLPPARPGPAGVTKPIVTAPPTGPLQLSGDDQQRVADCAGRDVVVTGSRSTYVMRGTCNAVVVRGNLLTVQAVVQPGARITVEGRGSIVSWAVPHKGRPPAVMVRGRDSRVQRAQTIGGEPPP